MRFLLKHVFQRRLCATQKTEVGKFSSFPPCTGMTKKVWKPLIQLQKRWRLPQSQTTSHLCRTTHRRRKKKRPSWENWRWRNSATLALSSSSPRDSEHILYQTSSAHFKKPAWSVPEDELAGSTFVSPCLLGVRKLKSWSTEGGSFQLEAHHTASDFSPPPPDPGETGNTCYLWSNWASMKIPLTVRQVQGSYL